MEIRDTICASHVEDSTFNLWHIQTSQIKLLLHMTKMTGIFQSEKWSHFLALFCCPLQLIPLLLSSI